MNERSYITCKALISFICDYLDGALDSRERLEFERHLAVCPSCVAYLASYKETIRTMKAVDSPPGEILDNAPAELIAAILAATSRRS
ncbi:MAG TPA: zf-HC2 domain-containing protein [Thermoanaerobaculia bacterium]|nr:zf-HC2 domain-containing protein [Thermoanaerobaculia bacterium]